MIIIDLTLDYEKHFLNRGSRFEYEKSYPELFDHYYRYWANADIPPRILEKPDISRRLRLINDELEFIERRFPIFDLDISALKIVLFVGQSTSNGHAFKSGNEFIVWLPIETYHTSQLVRVFLTHEISHALHYSRNIEFYFENNEEKNLISRQLITEGIATYLTARILEIDDLSALWADFLRGDRARSWLEECRRRESEICKVLFDNFNLSNSAIRLFLASTPDDIMRYRAGYYVGLRAVEAFVCDNKLRLSDLLRISRNEFEYYVNDFLRRRSE